MDKIKWHRKIMLAVVTTFLVHAPIERFLIPQMTFFPLYSWELGFGHISTPITLLEVFIESVNSEKFATPIPLKAWEREHGNWKLTNDYKVIFRLAKTVGREDRLHDMKKNKQTFEQRFFTKPFVRSVTYSVYSKTIDPLHYYLTKEFQSRRFLKMLHYERKQD